jgi:hypothetical protein
MAAGDETYSSGTVPKIYDTQRTLLVKLIIAEGGGSGGGGAAKKEIFHGNGDPTGVVIPGGIDAIYRQLDSVPAGLIWTWADAGPWIAPTT